MRKCEPDPGLAILELETVMFGIRDAALRLRRIAQGLPGQQALSLCLLSLASDLLFRYEALDPVHWTLAQLIAEKNPVKRP